jgi:hypothetical protein
MSLIARWFNAGVLACLTVSAVAGADPLPPTNWSVTATFRPDGTSVCTAKFPAPRDGQTLALEARTPKGTDDLVAAFIVGGLQPLLAGKRGTMRGVSVAIGSSFAAKDLKADWAKGVGDADSRITVVAAPMIGAVIQPVVNGGPLVIDVPLVTGTQHFRFDLTGAAGPMTAFVDCIRRWSVPQSG